MILIDINPSTTLYKNNIIYYLWQYSTIKLKFWRIVIFPSRTVPITNGTVSRSVNGTTIKGAAQSAAIAISLSTADALLPLAGIIIPNTSNALNVIDNWLELTSRRSTRKRSVRNAIKKIILPSNTSENNNKTFISTKTERPNWINNMQIFI